MKTEKGHGYPPALQAADRLHGVTPGFSDLLESVRPLEAALKEQPGGTSPSLYSSKPSVRQCTVALHAHRPAQAARGETSCGTGQKGTCLQRKSSSEQPTSSTLIAGQHAQSTSSSAELPGGSAPAPSHQKASSSGCLSRPSFTSVAARALLRLAEADNRVVGVTAAMPGGTGLHVVGSKFPRRMFDVGIAEQHAVTFAAGMAAEGLKPFCAIYSTFLQRAYDQIIHDVALQKLPVR